MKIKEYTKMHWNGQLPLWKSYWLNSVIIANLSVIISAFVVGIIVGLFLIILGIPNPGTIFWNFAAGIISIPVVTWSFVGTWRSANIYKLENPNKWVSWGLVAQVCIVLATLKSTVYVLSLLI